MSHVKYSAEVAGDVPCPHNEGSFLRNEGHTGKSTGKRWREQRLKLYVQTKSLPLNLSYVNNSILFWFKQGLNRGFVI